MLKSITRFIRDEEGATAIEYGIIAGLISIAIVTVVGNVGGQLDILFGQVLTALTVTP